MFAGLKVAWGWERSEDRFIQVLLWYAGASSAMGVGCGMNMYSRACSHGQSEAKQVCKESIVLHALLYNIHATLKERPGQQELKKATP